MTNVIDLNPRQPRIWVCKCGCSTFNLLDDGTAECAVCSAQPNEGDQGWYDRLRDGPERPSDLDAPVEDIQGNGSVEFARRRIADVASQEDVTGLIVVRDCGAVHAWSRVEDGKQYAWFRRHIAMGLKMIKSIAGHCS